jgi:hypothetical protein
MVDRVALTIGLLAFVCAHSPASAAVDSVAVCADKKAKASGKKASDLLEAFGKNAKSSNPVRFVADVSKAQSKLTKAFVKADGKGGCAISGDAGTIEAKIDAFALDVVSGISGTTTTTTMATTTIATTTSTSTSTTLAPGACNVGQTTACGGTCPNSGSCVRDSVTLECVCTPSECDVGASNFPVCVGNCGVSGGSCNCAGGGLCMFPSCGPDGCPPGASCVTLPGLGPVCLGGSCTTQADCPGQICMCYTQSCMCQ